LTLSGQASWTAPAQQYFAASDDARNVVGTVDVDDVLFEAVADWRDRSEQEKSPLIAVLADYLSRNR